METEESYIEMNKKRVKIKMKKKEEGEIMQSQVHLTASRIIGRDN